MPTFVVYSSDTSPAGMIRARNALRQRLWDGDDASAHQWLCHREGEQCSDGCDAEPMPDRLAFYQSELETSSLLPKRGGIIELSPNGDPFGSGFVGSQSTDGGKSWFYRGDVGAQTRAYWRLLARREGATLREVRANPPMYDGSIE